MLVPLPTPAVDILLSLSLAGSVLLLVISVGVRRSFEFLDFPTLLLMTTLFRLSLNIQTTRLILSQGDAGRVIDAFATLVVRNELVVGLVMFAIITGVQYLVIARGSERVAEVAARFALDALPGHQGAIDADLRSGALTPRQAAARRERLVEQSNFYGAMDGAVRFVKGDAIVGLVIIFVNILGGLAMGLSRGEGSMGEVLDFYGRLAIGDGLLAQLPALFVSLSAGVLVARVDRNQRAPAGVPAWLDPAMLVIPAALLFGLAMVPGMPRVAFSATAFGLIVTALWLNLRRSSGAKVSAPAPEHVYIRISQDLAEQLDGQSRFVDALHERCALALGIEMPRFVTATESRAEPGRLRVIYGRRLLLDTRVANDDVSTLVVAIYRAIMSHAPMFLDLQTVDHLLERARVESPAPVREALARISVVDLLQLMRGFLRERISLPPLSILLEVVSCDRRFGEDSERDRWVEIARQATASIWIHDIVSQPETLHWLRPSPLVCEYLQDHVVRGLGGLRLTLTQRELSLWHAHLTSCRGDPQGPHALILTTPRLRPVLALLTARLHPQLPVLSTAELAAAGIEIPRASIREFEGPDTLEL